MAMETEALGALLRRYRRQAGLTQEELAERALVSARSVSDIERGQQQRPHVSTLRRLADALGLASEPRVVFLSAGHGKRAQSQRQEHVGALPGPAVDGSILALPGTNLPDEPNRFIGREREIATISGLLQQAGVRLVTLTGPGGAGKTRLAIQVASTLLCGFRDGVFLVSLASVTNPTLVPSALARTLGLNEEGGVALSETLREHLRDKQLLLVLDNFEHLLDAAPLVAELLDACRELHVLGTSRIPLHLVREHEYPVPPLAVPDPSRLPPLEALCQYEAVALFVERAQAVKPEFAVTSETAPAVAEICARLDGLPLAIELAATRIKVFPPQELLQRLERCLQLLTGGARDLPTRQQTLRGTIDWSYSLLSEPEQALFARLSVFAGGCTFEAAEAVCSPNGALDVLEGLARLVDQNLLRQEGNEEARFSMLVTIREYAWERLEERGEVEVLRRHHAEYFGSMVLSAEPDIKGEREAAWFARFDRDRENIRAAIEWYRAHRPDAALLLGYVLHQYWIMRAELRERIRWIEDVYAHHELLPPIQRAKVLDMAVSLAEKVMHPRAEELSAQSMALREKLGDIAGKRDALERAADRLLREGQSVKALRLFEESLQLQRAHGQTDSLHYEEETLPRVMQAAQIVGDYAGATAIAEEALTRAGGRKNAHDIARWQTFLGWLTLLQGNHAHAEELLQRSLDAQRALGDKNCMPTSLVNLATLALERGDPQKAEELVQEGLIYVRDLQQTGRVAEHLVVLGRATLMRQELERAEKHFQTALTLAEQAADARTRAEAIWGLAALATARRDWERAMRLAGLASAVQAAAQYRPASIEEARYQQILAAVHFHLDDAAAELSWEQGRDMSTEESLPDTLVGTRVRRPGLHVTE